MNSDEIQAHRKARLRAAIDTFWGGSQTALARELRNKNGEPLKDGSFVGHLLKPLGEKGFRRIDEDRVREIEALRVGLKGWFDEKLAAQPAKTVAAIDKIRHGGLDAGLSSSLVDHLSPLEAASFTAGRRAVTVSAPEDLAPYTLRGFEVVIDSTRHTAEPDRLVVVLLASGKCHLGIFRPVVGGFEVDVGRGLVLDAQRYGIEVLGVATETRRRFD